MAANNMVSLYYMILHNAHKFIQSAKILKRALLSFHIYARYIVVFFLIGLISVLNLSCSQSEKGSSKQSLSSQKGVVKNELKKISPMIIMHVDLIQYDQELEKERQRKGLRKLTAIESDQPINNVGGGNIFLYFLCLSNSGSHRT